MNLRTRLAVENIIIIAVTVLVTAVSVYIYVSLNTYFSNQPDGYADNAIVVITNRGENVYVSDNISWGAAKSLVMDYEMSSKKIIYNNSEYSAKKEVKSIGEVYVFTPIADLTVYYKHMAVFVIIVFLLVFGVSTLVVSEYNRKNIIQPILSIKNDTVSLTDGNIDTAVTRCGIGEIVQLSDSIEQLRLKLKESVFYREKYDDNRKFLISGISHDLRTPVTAVRGYIEGVLDGVALNEEKRTSYLKTALSKVDAINEMIDDLLLYSKLDLNKIPFEIERVNINGYLSDSVIDSQNDYSVQKKKITYVCNCENDLYVNIDRVRFKRVIQNILNNSLKNIPENTGETMVILRQNQGSVIIEISDNGVGIKKEDLPYIFDRFYKADSARKVSGNGLGLTISKQIVEGLGGRIWALSHEGKGASIMISLKKC